MLSAAADALALVQSDLAAKGLGLLVWSPLAGGFLSGKFTRDSGDEDEGDVSHTATGALIAGHGS